MEKRDVIIENPSDMVSIEDAKFIQHTFSSVYKKEVLDAEIETAREMRQERQERRNKKREGHLDMYQRYRLNLRQSGANSDWKKLL